MNQLGKLVEIEDLREVWQFEDRDFTPWLAKDENIELLSSAIGLDITVTNTEEAVGNFRADIFGYETDTTNKIIIENQLTKTDHTHLGELITYAAGKNANYVIWIVKKATDEHRAAIEWLNSHTDDECGFFLCEIKLYKIGNSAIAPFFNVIEKPNNWVRTVSSNNGSSGIVRSKLPRITDMISWGVVKAGDIITAVNDSDGNEAILQSDGRVKTKDGQEMSMQEWLKGIYGWSSIQTYVYAIDKKSNKTLHEIRKEYMKEHSDEFNSGD